MFGSRGAGVEFASFGLHLEVVLMGLLSVHTGVLQVQRLAHFFVRKRNLWKDWLSLGFLGTVGSATAFRSSGLFPPVSGTGCFRSGRTLAC